MSMVKERPIIFSDLVWAIMQGKKTQTRRVIKGIWQDDTGEWFWKNNPTSFNPKTSPEFILSRCPYGILGDRLWVRETWGASPFLNRKKPCELDPASTKIFYKSDPDVNKSNYLWRSPIYMPRWASRITLEITGVRVERLQEISYTDCCRETGSPLEWEEPGPEPYHRQMHAVFALLWNEINAKRGCPWESNPWVWVLDFKTVNN